MEIIDEITQVVKEKNNNSNIRTGTKGEKSMIEVKEIRNTVNDKKFISKDYLLEQAISYVNFYVRRYFDEVRNKSNSDINIYHDICVLLSGYVQIGFFSEELFDLFLSEVSFYSQEPKYLKSGWYPQLMGATCYTLTGTNKDEN